jgi:hypothetical protein
MKLYTKESLTEALIGIAKQGWIPNARANNTGGIGNTLEDLLGITENNLPIPNASEWELKSQRLKTASLVTLFHQEPSPQAMKFVPQILLPVFGWQHNEAGRKYPDTERSFRQTLNALSTTDRGFGIKLDGQEKKLVVFFDAQKVASKHAEWLSLVKQNNPNLVLDPMPYWGFLDLQHKAATKLYNCFYVQAAVKKIQGIEHYHYKKITMLKTFNSEGFFQQIAAGNILVDFDARTGHNHGTKLRMRQNCLPFLYEESSVVFDIS